MENPEIVQQEIADLEKRLREKREQLSNQKESGEIAEVPHEKETLHEVVKEEIVQHQPQTPPEAPPVQTPAPPSVTLHTPLTDEMQAQVQNLVNIAFTDSPSAAIKKALATNNAALIDAFHDLLVDELYKYLIDNGKLKQFNE